MYVSWVTAKYVIVYCVLASTVNTESMSRGVGVPLRDISEKGGGDTGGLYDRLLMSAFHNPESRKVSWERQNNDVIRGNGEIKNDDIAIRTRKEFYGLVSKLADAIHRSKRILDVRDYFAIRGKRYSIGTGFSRLPVQFKYKATKERRSHHDVPWGYYALRG